MSAQASRIMVSASAKWCHGSRMGGGTDRRENHFLYCHIWYWYHSHENGIGIGISYEYLRVVVVVAVLGVGGIHSMRSSISIK